MEIINYSEATRNFKAVLDRVVDDQDCTVITRSGVEDAVIMPKSQYDSIMKTLCDREPGRLVDQIIISDDFNEEDKEINRLFYGYD